MQVAGMPAYTDITRANEIAVYARRIFKELKDAQADVIKYNNRERLFGIPVTSVSYKAYYLNIKGFEIIFY